MPLSSVTYFERFPQPWWLVVAAYEVVLLGTWLLERRRIRRYREAAGDPVGGGRSDRRYTLPWLLWLIVLQVPLTRDHLWKGDFPQHLALSAFGTALAIVGAAVRLHAIHHLQENFSYVITVTDKHRLVTSGPYRRIRHPAYAGLILFLLGVPLILCDLWFFLFVQIFSALTVTRRIRREERWMAECFGAEFEAWKARTRLLIPRVL